MKLHFHEFIALNLLVFIRELILQKRWTKSSLQLFTCLFRTRRPPSPEKASEKLKGTLSPSFLQDQFPDEYKEIKSNKFMEVQLQEVLGKLGAQGWELTNVSSIGAKLLFFFKRPDLSPCD